MIKPLRKRHLQIWILWVVLLPMGIIAAWVAVPEKVTSPITGFKETDAFPDIIGSSGNISYGIKLRADSEKKLYQLEFSSHKAPLVLPSMLIYRVTQSGNEILGRVGPKGKFLFSFPVDSSGNYKFILYDIIRNKTIDSVNFKTPL